MTALHLSLIHIYEMDPEDIQFSPVNLAKVIDLADSGAINSTVAKEVFEEVLDVYKRQR